MGEIRHHDDDNINHHIKKPKLTQTLISPAQILTEFAHHAPETARINNGSFGSVPNTITTSQRQFHLKFLSQPDQFFFNTLPKQILTSRKLLRSLINADDVSEVALVDNATTASAIVLQNVGRGFSEGRYARNDVVVMFSCAFQAVKKSIDAYVRRAGGEVVVVDLPFPVREKDEIVNAVIMPVKELVKVCREEGVDRVFVDAAHAIGSVSVDVKEIGADFYVSNLHKWFFCPPSVAVLYSRKDVAEDLHHPVVSHEYGNGLAIESAWIGTRDYSPQLVVPDVFEFVNRFEGGIEGIMKRNHDAVVEMGEMLAKSWGTSLGAPPEMCPNRFGVEVPIHYQPLRDEEAGPRDQSGGFVTGYARISHQVYNTVDDYIKFRDAVNQLLRDGFSCKMLIPREE
ncbi:pyridoxal phosphate (PLP)-dependent transferases superfamily protein [Artemisia annua]|uniref:Pyridoxal phosphate (PLP)-dependent transferases superfamily protein n=1 Tax=Artemisia annua TaxID=35608 RepID=A0A2U1KRP5_ARTAN|nr:pyridoxal phosphate (PLP)-dependent transferases superfamily protein [Artemisia annua]